MEQKIENVTLTNLGEGVVEELFGEEFYRVLENMLDVNTPAKAKRKITFTFTFEPNEDRNMMRIWVDSKTSLAPLNGYASQAFIGRENGIASAKEHKKRNMPGLFDEDKNVRRVK